MTIQLHVRAVLFLLVLFPTTLHGDVITVRDKAKLHEEAINGRLERFVNVKLSREIVDENMIDLALSETVGKMLPEQSKRRKTRRRTTTTTATGETISSKDDEYIVPNKLNIGEWTRTFRYSDKFEEKHKAAGLDLFYKVAISETSSSAEEIGTAVESALLSLDGEEIEGVDLAEPIPQAKLYHHSNDPYRKNQPHYDAISLDEAWDITIGDSSVVVAVIDTGMQMDHSDLQNNVWMNPGEIDCNDGVDNDGNGYIDDCYGYNFGDENTVMLGDGSHGTHCAGTIAADTDNGIGVSGVAGGCDGLGGISLMTLVMFGKTRTSSGDEAIVYAADHGSHIISNSWGYTSSNTYSSSVLYAVEYAVNAGSVVTFAAGNDGTDEPWYPAFFSDAVAVAAVDNDGTKATFSNYGDWIDISAPGVRVYSTVADDNFAYYWGTSMATPHVSGVLALGFSANPLLTREIALDCLYSTATDIESVNSKYQGELGAGLINAKAFVECAIAATPAPTASNLYVDPSCNFEGDHLCEGWETGVDAKTFFSTDSGTPSGGTGPSSSDGFFVYTEASYTFNADFDLVSPRIVTLGYDFDVTFDYNMYDSSGSSMGTLSLQYTTDSGTSWTEIWSVSGNQGNAWNTVTITVPNQTNKIRFWATTGRSYRSDICLDNINFAGLPDPTKSKPAPTPRPTTYTPTPGPTTYIPTPHPTASSPTSHPTSEEPTRAPSSAPTLSPTLSSSVRPTLSPTTCSGDNCYAMIVDGFPGKDSGFKCGGDTNLADSISALKTEAVAGTRCCGSSSSDDISICTGGSCEKVDYNTAKAACEQEGLRLCTESEILAGRALGTGCTYNFMHVWTSTNGYLETSAPTEAPTVSPTACSGDNCYAMIVDGFADKDHTSKCGGDKDLDDSMSILKTEAAAGTRCCGASSSDDISICTGGTCEKVDYITAKSSCESQGLRLCSQDEILAGRALGTGCSYNYMHVWTSTVGSLATPAPTIAQTSCSGDNCFAMMVDGFPEAAAGTRCCGSSSSDDISICTGGSCEKVDYDTAKSACEQEGLRLCTENEILAGRALGTGCRYNFMHVWTSTIGSSSSSSTSTASSCKIVARGKSRDNEVNSMAKSRFDLAGTRCCGSTTVEDISICSWNGEEVDYYTASSMCEAKGLSLCTADQILSDGRCAGTGCSYDGMFVWTSTSTNC